MLIWNLNFIQIFQYFRYGQKCFLYCIDSSKKLHSNHLDEIELILIFQIFALKTGNISITMYFYNLLFSR